MHACALKKIHELIALAITRISMNRLLARTHTKTRARAKSHTMRNKIHAFSHAVAFFRKKICIYQKKTVSLQKF